MDHYVDIRSTPNPEIATAHVMNALAGKLHRALAILYCDDVGVSFPRFRTNPPSLGHTLRLHSTRARLLHLGEMNWLGATSDYAAVSELLLVPANVKHRVVRRVQTPSNAERLRRRQIKRHGWTEQEAREKIPNLVEKLLQLPYLNLRSQSTGQPFRLFIDHLPCQDRPTSGTFNAYGLSRIATIPWF